MARTWRDNVYLTDPGDVRISIIPFAPNAEWTLMNMDGPQIHEYPRAA